MYSVNRSRSFWVSSSVAALLLLPWLAKSAIAQTSAARSRPWSCLASSAITTSQFHAPRNKSCDSSPSVRSATAIIPPDAPSGLSVSATGQALRLQWTDSSRGSPATSYVLLAGSASSATDLAYADLGSSSTSLSLTSVPSGTYYLRIAARNASGTSAPSNEVAVSVRGDCVAPPLPPTHLVAAASAGTITLMWQAPTVSCAAISYVIEAGSAPQTTNLGVVGTGSALTAFSSDTVPAGRYYFRVKAKNAFGVSAASEETAVIMGSTPVSIPIGSAFAPYAGNLNGMSVSTNAPTPLTPLKITGAGIDPNAAVSVQFSAGASYSVTVHPLHIDPDGTITVAVPLYLDATGEVSSGTMSMTVTQAGRTSAATNLNVQSLPSVQGYGLPNGMISHGFYEYAARRIATRLNQLQSLQELPGHSFDTSAAQEALSNLLISTIEARNDIDRVATNPALSIDAGQLPGGASLQFDAKSLDMMDRMIGLYLSEASPTLLQAKNGVTREPTRAARNTPQASPADLRPVIDALSKAANYAGIAESIQSSAKTDKTLIDWISSIAGEESGTVGLLGLATGSKVAGVLSPALGALGSSLALLQNFGNELGDLGFLMVASRYGNPPEVVKEAQDDIEKNAADSKWNTLEAELNIVGLAGAWGSWGTAVTQSLENGGAGVALQGAQLFTSIAHMASQQDDTSIENLSATAASGFNLAFSSAQQGIADVLGNAQIANSQGSLSAPTGVAVCCFADGALALTLADPSGSYALLMPLNNADTDYRNMVIGAFDPVTGDVIASAPIDLGGLTTSAPARVPPIMGICVDDDAGDPDEDDPDCDSTAIRANRALMASRLQQLHRPHRRH
jgi:hypothetical protein